MAVVYQHKTKDTDQIFYIGISNSYKRPKSSSCRNKFWNRVANKHGWYYEILLDNITRSEAIEIEIYLIFYYGRRDLGTGNLTNLTGGGEGMIAMSEDLKKQISNANRGKKYQDSVNKRKGRTHSHERKKLLSDLMKGNNYAKVLKGTKKPAQMGIKLGQYLKSDLNKKNKPIIAGGVRYYSMVKCREELNLTKWFILKNINDPNKIDWYYE